MRKKIIAANWKMNMTLGESDAFLTDFLLEIKRNNVTDVDIVIVPPFTELSKVGERLTNTSIALGAQNMSFEKSGAFTGEISAMMLRDIYAHYVVLGHSERRTLFGETDAIVNKKVKAAHEALLKPILCIGETLPEREANKVEEVLETQLRGSLAGLNDKEILETVIAYEPVWAIGTGRVATPEQAQAAHAFIRKTLAQLADPTVAEKVRIQYGGSVKPDNAQTLLSQPDIDGALVGGASLDPRAFAEIVKAGAAVE